MLGMQHASRPAPQDLPPAPSADASEQDSNASPSEAALAADGGAGDVLTYEQVLRRYVLVEGTTQVWDLDKARVMKKTAFEARVGKPLAKQWVDDTTKKLISDEKVKEIEQARNKAGKKSDLATFGENHPKMVLRYFNLAKLYEAKGNMSRSSDAYANALRVLRKTNPGDTEQIKFLELKLVRMGTVPASVR